MLSYPVTYLVIYVSRMSSFPPKKWEVRYLKDMETLTCEAPGPGEIGMAAFLAVKPSGIEEGNFRFALAGPDKLKIRFKLTDVIDSRLFEGMFAEAELSVGDQIQFTKNTVCSEWSDIVELVNSQDYMITDNDDDDVSEAFLTALEQHKSDLKGKIVLYNVPFEQTFIETFKAYGKNVVYRAIGASRAAKYGASAVMVRSMTNAEDNNPHTGALNYLDSLPKIPAAAVGIQDLARINEWIDKGKPVQALLVTNGKMLALMWAWITCLINNTIIHWPVLIPVITMQ